MHNFRDLAGVACRGATAQIKPGLVLRSATPADAEKADVDRLLRAFPSLRVLDLRSEEDALKDDGQRLLAKRTRYVEMLPKATGQKRLSRHVLTDRLHLTLPLLPFRIMRALPVPGVRAAGGFVVDRGVRRFLETIELTDVYWWILRERGEALRGVLSDLSEAGRAQVRPCPTAHPPTSVYHHLVSLSPTRCPPAPAPDAQQPHSADGLASPCAGAHPHPLRARQGPNGCGVRGGPSCVRCGCRGDRVGLCSL